MVSGSRYPAWLFQGWRDAVPVQAASSIPVFFISATKGFPVLKTSREMGCGSILVSKEMNCT